MLNNRYKIITTKKELIALIKACKKTKYACVDFETNAKPLYSGLMVPTILSVSFQVGSSIIIPLGNFESPLKEKTWKRFLLKFGREVIEDPAITKCGWNWKFDNQIFQIFGVYSRGRVIDGMLAKYLLDEERPNGLKDMVKRYLPEWSNYEDMSEKDWSKKPLNKLAEYGAKDTDATLRLCLFFEKKLIDLGFYSLYRNLIMMASRVLQSAEKKGMKLDIDFNDKLIEKYGKLISDKNNEIRSLKVVRKFQIRYLEKKKEDYIEAIEKEIKALKKEQRNPVGRRNYPKLIENKKKKKADILAGVYSSKKERDMFSPINFGSQKQMVELLYSKDGLNLPVLRYTKNNKTKKFTTTPSTAEDALVELKPKDKHGFINMLLELRGLETVNSTFILGIREKLGADGRIHPKFNIHGTVTGRLSSNDPNFQNLPRTTTNPDVKKMMIPTPGKLFLMMDYSQAELRVLAHMAKETTMLEWFRTGKDIHLASACKKYKQDYDKIIKIYEDETHPEYVTWKKRRKQAKTINFGIAYEQTAMKLSESLSEPDAPVSVEEAQLFLDEFFRDFPNIKKYIDKQHKLAEKQGWVKTMFGRKRRLPGVYSEVYREYLEALRFSSNAPIQGTATDFALFSSILMWEKVRLGELPFFEEETTVHDSLVFEIDPKDITKELIHDMWNICRNPNTKKYFGFQIKDVDMEVDFGIGRTYAEELPYTPGYDYTKLLDEGFNKDEYYKEHSKYKKVHISEYKKLKVA